MKARKLQVKFFAEGGEAVAPEPFVPVFHDWIKRGALPELMIDVVDYEHVFEGPSVLMVGHESDYAIDYRGGRAGLVYSRKRGGSEDPKELVVDALRRGLRACKLLSEDALLANKPVFTAREVEIRINDRRVARNDEGTFAEIKPVVEAALKEVYGGQAFTIERGPTDPRQMLTFVIRAPGASTASALAQSLN